MNESEYDYSQQWETVRKIMINDETTYSINQIFQDISYIGSGESRLMLGVPSKFVYDKFHEFWLSSITELMEQETGEKIDVSCSIIKNSENENAPVENSPKQQAAPEKRPVVQQNQRHNTRFEAGVNTDYRFDNFIIGANCTYAYNASLAIAKNPGISYNPCLIYGGVGLGKTHLINAIGNYIIENRPDLKVRYITAEAFTNEFINSITTGGPRNSISKSQYFKNRYRKIDVLLMDDIQFIQNKTQSQEELFHTFNDLYEAKKQIVFTCDRPINELKGVMDRLTNRFDRGLNVDLQPPAYETRVAILRNKCQVQGKVIDDDIIDYVAQTVRSNVRDLEASLIKLISFTDLLGEHLTLNKAKELLSKLPFVQPQIVDQSITVQEIIKEVSNYFGVNPSDIRGRKKTKSIVEPRQIAMYLSKQLTNYSFTEIGREFGNKDHSTVMHACEKISSRCKVTGDLDKAIEYLKRELLK